MYRPTGSRPPPVWTHCLWSVAPQLQTCVDPVTSCVKYFTPRGRFLHVPPMEPRSDWAHDGEPWWRDRRYEVGVLSAKTRWIRIINTLTSQEQRLQVRRTDAAEMSTAPWSSFGDLLGLLGPVLQVCSEETLEEILQRYLGYNSHARSYTWKYDETELNMAMTLEENGVIDEDEQLQDLRLDPDRWTPALLLHFNDDLSEE